MMKSRSAVWRCDQSEHDVDDDNHSEMHHVDAERLCGRNEDPDDNQKNCRPLQNAAEKQQQDIDQNQEADRRQVEACQNDAQAVRDVFDRDNIVEDERPAISMPMEAVVFALARSEL